MSTRKEIDALADRARSGDTEAMNRLFEVRGRYDAACLLVEMHVKNIKVPEPAADFAPVIEQLEAPEPLPNETQMRKAIVSFFATLDAYNALLFEDPKSSNTKADIDHGVDMFLKNNCTDAERALGEKERGKLRSSIVTSLSRRTSDLYKKAIPELLAEAHKLSPESVEEAFDIVVAKTRTRKSVFDLEEVLAELESTDLFPWIERTLEIRGSAAAASKKTQLDKRQVFAFTFSIAILHQAAHLSKLKPSIITNYAPFEVTAHTITNMKKEASEELVASLVKVAAKFNYTQERINAHTSRKKIVIDDDDEDDEYEYVYEYDDNDDDEPPLPATRKRVASKGRAPSSPKAPSYSDDENEEEEQPPPKRARNGDTKSYLKDDDEDDE